MSLDGSGDVLDSGISEQACPNDASLSCSAEESRTVPNSCLGGLVESVCPRQALQTCTLELLRIPMAASLLLFLVCLFVCFNLDMLCVTESVALGNVLSKQTKACLIFSLDKQRNRPLFL